MVDPQLQEFVDKARQAKVEPEVAREALVAAGWSKQQVAEAMVVAAGLEVPRPGSASLDGRVLGGLSSNRSAASLWDVFEHILMFISLYATMTALAIILHDMVDRHVRSATEVVGSTDSGMVLVALSAFIVSFPVFALLFLRITRRTQARPETRQLLMRKVLIYLTLIVTFVILLYQAGRAIYNLIGGNVSLNFVLHLLVSVGLAGVIFAYYMWQVAEDRHSLG